uniref:Peptidase S1 domain-containing protein n=1 Tax=Plectus sambesii TaxID=2011161 RepID=A0A914VRH0_9BILA
MKTTVTFLLLVAVASAAFDCGRTPIPPDETRIVGGQRATPYSWPWQAVMCFTRGSGSGSCSLTCGASVIDRNWVMSAAHCVEDYVNSPKRFKIKMGVYDYRSNNENGEIVSTVSKIIIHPQFNKPKSMAHDMALLRMMLIFYGFQLSSPIAYTDHIQPVCLPANISDVVAGGKNLYVTGWGATSENGDVSSQLRQVNVPSLTPAQCESQYRRQIDHNTMFCAGRAGKDSCQGDSGGPIVIKRSDGRWWQAGIVSWGIGCAEPNHSGILIK